MNQFEGLYISFWMCFNFMREFSKRNEKRIVSYSDILQIISGRSSYCKDRSLDLCRTYYILHQLIFHSSNIPDKNLKIMILDVKFLYCPEILGSRIYHPCIFLIKEVHKKLQTVKFSTQFLHYVIWPCILVRNTNWGMF